MSSTNKIKMLLLLLVIGVGLIMSTFTLSFNGADNQPPQDNPLQNDEKALNPSSSTSDISNLDDSAHKLNSNNLYTETTSTHTHSSDTTAPANLTPKNYDSEILSSISLEQAQIDKVYVDKSEQRLYLMQGDTAIKSYHIALGDAPKGHKHKEGDERTPEGSYTLDYKNENSIAYRSIHVSYPNAKDIAHAKSLGVSPGGDIMIHGQMNGAEKFTQAMQKMNWTDGCMAVTNDEMDEIMDAVNVGTPIEIEW